MKLLALGLVLYLVGIAQAFAEETPIERRAKEIAVTAAAKGQTLSDWLEAELPAHCASAEGDLLALKHINDHLADFAKYIQAPADFNHVVTGDKKAEPLSIRAFLCDLSRTGYAVLPIYLKLQLVPPSTRARDERGFFAYLDPRQDTRGARATRTAEFMVAAYPETLDLGKKVDRQAVEALLKLDARDLTAARAVALSDLVGTLYANPAWTAKLPALKSLRFPHFNLIDQPSGPVPPADWPVFCYSLPAYLKGQGCRLALLDQWLGEGRLDVGASFDLLTNDQGKSTLKGSAIHAFVLGLGSRYWTDEQGRPYRPDLAQLAAHFVRLLTATPREVLLASKVNLIKLLLGGNVLCDAPSQEHGVEKAIALVERLTALRYPLERKEEYPWMTAYLSGPRGAYHRNLAPSKFYFEWIASHEELARAILAVTHPQAMLSYNDEDWRDLPLRQYPAANFFYQGKDTAALRQGAMTWARLMIEAFPARAEEIQVRAAQELTTFLRTVDELKVVYEGLGGARLIAPAQARIFAKALALEGPTGAFVLQLWRQAGLQRYGYRVLSDFGSDTPAKRVITGPLGISLLALGADPLEALDPADPRSRYVDQAFKNTYGSDYAAQLKALTEAGVFKRMSREDLETLVRTAGYTNDVDGVRMVQDIEAASGQRLDLDGLNAKGGFKLLDYYARICEHRDLAELALARLRDVSLRDASGNTIAQAALAYCKQVSRPSLEAFAHAGVDLAAKNKWGSDLAAQLIAISLGEGRPQPMNQESFQYLVAAKTFDPLAPLAPHWQNSFAAILYLKTPLGDRAIREAFRARALELGYDLAHWDGKGKPPLSLDAYFFAEKQRSDNVDVAWLLDLNPRVDGDWLERLVDARPLVPGLFKLNYDASRVFASGRNALFSLIRAYGSAKTYSPDFKAIGELLIAHGADPALKDSQGQTPIDYARQIRDWDEKYLRDVYLWTNARH
jgi:hypothetical protein